MPSVRRALSATRPGRPPSSREPRWPRSVHGWRIAHVPGGYPLNVTSPSNGALQPRVTAAFGEVHMRGPGKSRYMGGRTRWPPLRWELEVQSWARAHTLAPDERCCSDSTTWASGRWWLGPRALAMKHDVGIQILAVDVRYRRKGG